MKTIKRVKGFTMIELIVVMAILAVLCGVLVPNALGWIKDSKLKTCNSEAKTVFNTAVTVLQDYQLEGKVRTGIADAYGKSTTDNNFVQTIKQDDNNDVVSKINSKLGSNFSTSYWAIKVNVANADNRNSNTVKVESAVYGDSTTSIYVGRYPVPANQSCSGGIVTALADTSSNLFNTDTNTNDILYKQ
jgi:prepilin-type N-terminal cleavage/methylation domain-containing protein